MGRKIFFLDLDGTLLTDEKLISADTYSALKKFCEAGNVIAVNSGRPMKSITDTMKALKLDIFKEAYAIAFNGAWIRNVKTGEDILKKTVSLEDTLKISGLARAKGLHCQTYSEDHILSSAEDDELFYYKRTVKLPYKILPSFPEGITEAPCKLLTIKLFGEAADIGHELYLEAMGIHPEKKLKRPGAHYEDTPLPDVLKELADIVNTEYAGRVSALKSNPYFMEIFPADAGKGEAVHDLAKLLSVDIKDTLAAGDAENDISMLEAAGTGIAMFNAEESVKKAADVITLKDNNNDGLAEFFINNSL